MKLNKEVFRQNYKVFQDRILQKTKIPFTSFKDGLAFEWEGYKEPLRQRALSRLQVQTWRKSTIGSGAILRKLIQAIEIPKEGGAEANNLVAWRNQYGDSSRSHHALVEALETPALTKRAESWAYEFYRENGDPEEAFEQLREIAGSRYDLLAYLFFIADSQRFMPVRVLTFDAAFRALGIDLKMSGNCSWENYREYVSTLQAVQAELQEMPGQSHARLVDAHSFCWLLVRPELERADTRLVASAKGVASNAKIYSEKEIAIYEAVETVVTTVKNSNGQIVEITKKIKELWMSKDDLSEHIKYLLEKQQNKCTLSGIKFHFKGGDHQRNLSVDRKDSNGQYAVGNVQLVCKFINMWKRNTSDEEFLRLLALVRAPDEEL